MFCWFVREGKGGDWQAFSKIPPRGVPPVHTQRAFSKILLTEGMDFMLAEIGLTFIVLGPAACWVCVQGLCARGGGV